MGRESPRWAVDNTGGRTRLGLGVDSPACTFRIRDQPQNWRATDPSTHDWSGRRLLFNPDGALKLWQVGAFVVSEVEGWTSSGMPARCWRSQVYFLMFSFVVLEVVACCCGTWLPFMVLTFSSFLLSVSHRFSWWLWLCQLLTRTTGEGLDVVFSFCTRQRLARHATCGAGVLLGPGCLLLARVHVAG